MLSLINLILFCLGSVGLTEILVYSKIKNIIMSCLGNPKDYLTCHQCVGFWVGLLFGYFLFEKPTIMFLAGFTTSLLAVFSSKLHSIFDVWYVKTIDTT